MIAQGSDLNYRDADGRSTLYVLALENHQDTATFLLSRGAHVEAADLEGRTPLHVAAWQGHFDMVQLLLNHQANVNAVDNDRRTALQSAAWQGHDRVVNLLLERGAEVDHMCNQGATALCIAAQEGHEEVVRVLLRQQANPNHADQFGRTPVRVALKSGHLSVVRILEDFGATPVSYTKSRSSSSNSSTDMRPPNPTPNSSSVTSPGTTGAVGGGSAAGNGGASVNSTQAAGTTLVVHSSPSDSPESTFDRRKSYQSNNSSKSSSNMTTSTNQSTQSQPQQAKGGEGECLTFTQQLQQCSMGKNRSRPISRVLSPVSEPQSPVQSPPVSPVVEIIKIPSMSISNVAGSGVSKTVEGCGGGIGGVTVTSSGRVCVDLGGGKEVIGGRPISSPNLERNLNMLAPSPVKCASSKPEKISATINIITNPNADMLPTPEEPVWQMHPVPNLKTSRPPPPPPTNYTAISPTTAPALPPRIPLTDSPTKIVMGSAGHTSVPIESRSPELRRKRNGIVTNPKVTKSPGVNNGHYNKLSAADKKNGAAKGSVGNGGSKGFSNIQPNPPGNGRDSSGKAVRPTGLPGPLKKEAPM